MVTVLRTTAMSLPFSSVTPTRFASGVSKLREWTKTFDAADISEPSSSAQLIISHVLKKKMYSELNHAERKRPLTIAEVKKIDALCKKRLMKLPVQYVIEEWDFCGLTLKMKPPVFIPRPETVGLVDAVLNDINVSSRQQFSLLEVGCGSGAITLAILDAAREGKIAKRLVCTAIDTDLNAVNLTRKNARLCGLEKELNLFHCDVKSMPFSRRFDGIVSNPPYIPTKDMLNLQPEILKYESDVALHGGADGLNVIRDILSCSEKLLTSDGWIWMEVDTSHPRIISTNFPDCQVKNVKEDFFGRERFVKLLKAS